MYQPMSLPSPWMDLWSFLRLVELHREVVHASYNLAMHVWRIPWSYVVFSTYPFEKTLSLSQNLPESWAISLQDLMVISLHLLVRPDYVQLAFAILLVVHRWHSDHFHSDQILPHHIWDLVDCLVFSVLLLFLLWLWPLLFSPQLWSVQPVLLPPPMLLKSLALHSSWSLPSCLLLVVAEVCSVGNCVNLSELHVTIQVFPHPPIWNPMNHLCWNSRLQKQIVRQQAQTVESVSSRTPSCPRYQITTSAKL